MLNGSREGPREPISKDNKLSLLTLITSNVSSEVSQCMGGHLVKGPIQSKWAVPKILLTTYC